MEEAKGVPNVFFRRNPGQVEAVATVPLGHGELFHPVDQVRVVAVTPCRLDDEGAVFEGNETSGGEGGGQQRQISFSKPSRGTRFLFLSFRYIVKDTEGKRCRTSVQRGIVLHPIISVKDKRILEIHERANRRGSCCLLPVCFFQKTVCCLLVAW